MGMLRKGFTCFKDRVIMKINVEIKSTKKTEEEVGQKMEQ